MLALLDSDLIVYRIGFTTEDVDAALACIRAKETVEKILSEVNATSYKLFLTEENDPKAFRKGIYPEYKAHRTKPRPKWYKELRDYLQVEYGAEVCYEIEADDALGIAQTTNNMTTDPDNWFFPDGTLALAAGQRSIICSIDKDLLQIPGLHYNFVKLEFSEVSLMEGLRTFYTQLLTGDSADNIKGVWKVGPKKAEQILAGADTEQEMFNRVRDTYANDEEMLMNGRCLWVWKKANDDYQQHWNRLTTTQG